jgi:mono/diheme cytochrome c family protein
VTTFVAGCIVAVTIGCATSAASEVAPSAERGYGWLTEKAYLPPDFDQSTFDQLWTIWPAELRSQAETASDEARRRMAFSRYGLTARLEDPSKPLQYVVDEQGNWTMNCFACHGGKVLGKTIPGLPNSHFALETLTADVRRLKLRLRKPLTRMEVGSLVMPLGKTNGTTNAVMFGVALMAFRDAELNLYPDRIPPKMVHHDMDAPAWWHFKRKEYIYIDGFARKGHRALMQFMLVHENGPAQFKEWENDFRDVFAFLESLQPPPYPFSINKDLTGQGERIFNDTCARCHGSYGSEPSYPEEIIPLDEVATDRVRFDALRKQDRKGYHESWFNHFGQTDTVFEPEGYVAPPLDGIWASAPYFHNGSVPTLWHVLNSQDRPAVWRRSENGFDEDRVGLLVDEFDKLPSSIRSTEVVREYFNTDRFGKSARGHTFPDELSDSEKLALLEYLKTL